MKNAVLLFVSVLFLSHCTTLEFEKPLPNEGQDIKTLPRSLVGTYQNPEDSNSIIKEYKRIDYIPKDASWEFRSQYFLMVAALDTSQEAFVRNDSLFSATSDSTGPEFAAMVKRVADRYVTEPKLRYRVEPVKGLLTIYDEKTEDPTPHLLVLRKQNDTYFFNIQEPGAKFWQTTSMQQTPNGIQFQYLSYPLGNVQDLPFATRQVIERTAEGAMDTSLVAMPNDRELEKYRNNHQLARTENLIRLER